MASIRFERVGGIGGSAVAHELGAQAYQDQKPIWTNPAIGEEARAWRDGYLGAQAKNGGYVYQQLPPRKRRRRRLVIQGPGGGGRRTAARRAASRLASA
jgi:hypothetical protein